jgi:PKD repeat protein
MTGHNLDRKDRRFASGWLISAFLFLGLLFFTFFPSQTRASDDFIIAVDDYSRLYYAKSNGGGTFADYSLIGWMGGYYSRAITINDFNNDGKMDFVVGRGISSTGYYYLFLNDGSNHFELAGLVGTQTNADSYAMDMASGDFNNDGNMDFIANGNQSTTGRYLGDGKGHFTKTEMNLGAYGRGMDTADFDNDGNLDVVRARYSTGYINVLWGDGTGAFPTGSADAERIGDAGGDPYGVVAGDFNEDGFADIIANSGSGGDPYLWTGKGDRTFTYVGKVDSLDFDRHGGYDAYDYNGDGHLDITAVNYNGGRLLYYPGIGDGTFGTAVEIGATSSDVWGVSAMPMPAPIGVPVAAITPSQATIVEGGSVDFDGSGSTDAAPGTITSWNWAFGDGGTDTAENPLSHAFAAEGTYSSTLTVTDDTGKKDTAVSRIMVQGYAPVVAVTPVVFGELYAEYGVWDSTLNGADYASDTENKIVQYEWDFGQLSEDFETGNTAGYPAVGWTAYAGTWAINNISPVGGFLSYKQTNASADRTQALLGTAQFQNDIVVEADVHLESGAGEEAQILFRAQDQNNNYEFIIRGRGYNDVLLYRRVNGIATSLAEYDLPSTNWGSSYPIDVGRTYHAKIICQGSWIYLFLDGHFLFSAADSTFLRGKVGFSTYRTVASFDNLVVRETASGQIIHYATDGPGVFDAALTVTDAGGQSSSGAISFTRTPQAPPVADAGGPYSADETNVQGGGWTFALDSTGSTDDVEISHRVWNLGIDEFTGSAFQDYKWFTNGSITQNDVVSLTGSNTWDTRYMVSKSIFPNTRGQIFQAKIMTPGSGSAMFGFKNNSATNFHYNQFPYEFYIYNGGIYIYENSNSRGDTGFDMSYNTWYDFKIELTGSGAVYSYRLSGTTDWTIVYTSGYTPGDTELRKGMVVYSNTYHMDDFVETTAGETPGFTLYKGTGSHNVDLTVYDRALQSHTDTTQVVITAGAAPIADAGSDQVLDETHSAGGQWTVNFDASASTDDHGIYRYEWDFNYDGVTFNPSGVSGSTASHVYEAPGIYTVAVRITDHALQATIDTMSVAISQGNPPVADAGGPYSVDEGTGSAIEGHWTVTMDGSGSHDNETSIMRYMWDFGTYTFDGTQISNAKWYYSGQVVQDDAITITSATNYWGSRYLCSKEIFTRAKGLAFEARVNLISGSNAMIGFKNTSTTNFDYGQMPYALYFTGGNIYVYESGASRGDTGFNYSLNTEYDIKIELKETQGARYYYRAAGAADWILVYDSVHSSETQFRKNIDVYNGVFKIDDLKEVVSGQNPTHLFSGLGSHPVTLTVWDQSGQSDTDSSSVTTHANAPPAPDAGPDQSAGEADAFEGTWTRNFDASGSTDDFAISKYEWDFDHDGVYDAVGITASHIFNAAGNHTVTLRVTDHALQSATDTMNVILTSGAAPVAQAGPDITTEGHWPVYFNGGGSSDDVGIYRYEWQFDDFINLAADTGPKSVGKGKIPRHNYWKNGDYAVTLTVYDSAMQSDSDTLAVHVVTGAPPVANAGGPYTAAAGGPPAYFNGGTSTDDYGIVKYLWDVDILTDSNGDGTADNDMDVVGRKPFYTYAAAGTYTAKLTVVDGAGQTASATATVNVADNLPPDVICVPWRSADPAIPHDTYNGRSIRLKAIVRDVGDLTYQWNFGDGTVYPAAPGAVTNKYAIEASHVYPNSPDGTPYVATLKVWDSNGLSGSDQYYVIVRTDNYDVRTNIAIDEGLWYTHKNQNKGNGGWSDSTYTASATASAIQSFEINGHLQEGDNQENPYIETVNRGFDYLFTVIQPYTITVQTAGNPDSNGNGIGVESTSGQEIYEGGMIMDALASSNNPLGFATTGGANINGRFFFHLLTDMVDMYAWGQDDSGSDRGGWRYDWQSGADNSACQWAAIGMLAAEDNFGVNVPQFVKQENNNYWLWYSYDGTGFGYTGPGNGVALTPSGMVQLAFCDQYTTDSRWRTAEDYIANNWFWQNNNYYAIYAMTKALRLARPNPVVLLQATGLDWYNDPTTGVRKRIVDQQGVSGTNWGSWDSSGHGGRCLETSWAVITLTPSLFVQPPVADAGDDIIWAYGLELAFDASASFHLDPTRTLVKYEWDFDGDGTYDFTTSNPSDPNAKYTYPDPNPSEPGNPPTVFEVRLRVTDDNEPAQTDVDIRRVTVAEPPHAPFADPGGAYHATTGIPFTLDGSESYDIDLGDSITRFEWDLDNDGVWFDDVDIDTTDKTVSYTYAAPGVYFIGLRVTDKGVFNPLGCTPGVNCTPLVSLPTYTTVTVELNQAPVADAGGPYTINEGAVLNLNGTGSSDPNGDPLAFAWDLDGDGSYDDSTAATPSHIFADEGAYTIGLQVSDSLLNDSDTATVTVLNVAPSVDAGADQTVNEGQSATFGGTATDPGADTLSYAWDFGDGTAQVTGTLTPAHPYRNNGIYTVTLTVTDGDGGVGTDTLTVTVENMAPVVSAGPDQAVIEGSTVSFSGSFTDAGLDDTHVIHWDFGDGAVSDGSLTPAHVYADNGSYTVTLTVADNDGGTGTDTLVVTVSNAAPVVDAGANQTAVEGGTVSLAATFTDAGSGDNHLATINWGDGSSGAGTVVGGTVTGSHAYADNGVYSVTVTVTDSNAGAGSDTMTVTVSNAAPVVYAGPDQAVDRGDTATFSGSFGDPGSADTHTITWNFGDATPVVTGTLTPTHVFATAGIYTVTLTVTDDDGGTDSDTLSVEVRETAQLAADLTGVTVLAEAVPGTFDATGSVGPYPVVSYAWDWNYNGSVFAPSGDTGAVMSHAWNDNGSYTVAVRVTDSHGGVDIATLAVTVNDLAPTAAVSGNALLGIGQTGAYGASASTSSPDAIASYEWAWSYNGVTFTPSADTGVNATHAWTAYGTFTVAVRVTDDDGTTDIAAMDVVVECRAALDGDVDGDGDVDKNDIQKVISLRNKPASVSPACDLDCDGFITSLDARIVTLLWRASL